MKWYLITKDGEYALGRFTDTRCRNEQRHGWRVVARWSLKPTDHAVREAMIIDGWDSTNQGATTP